MKDDPNQGEGDRAAARRYDEHLKTFIDDGKVAPAAADAEAYVDRAPDDAAKAERAARGGPHAHGEPHAASRFDGFVARGRAAIARLRSRLHR